MLDREGRGGCRHRTVNEKPPFIHGEDGGSADTDIGRLGILIGGDLVRDTIIGELDRSLQLLIVPMSRRFDDSPPNGEVWMTEEERGAYLGRVTQGGRPTVIVNALDTLPSDGAFGGAMVVRADGALLAESPHGTDDMLGYDLPLDGGGG